MPGTKADGEGGEHKGERGGEEEEAAEEAAERRASRRARRRDEEEEELGLEKEKREEGSEGREVWSGEEEEEEEGGVNSELNIDLRDETEESDDRRAGFAESGSLDDDDCSLSIDASLEAFETDAEYFSIT